MQKSSTRTSDYRAGSSRAALVLATFREQMADFARAERLLELRESAHLSREKAAAEIGVSAKALYAWEHGGKIKWENAQRAAAFYKVDPESLVSRHDPVVISENGLEPESSQLDRIEAKLDALLRHLDVPSRDLGSRLGDLGERGPTDEERRAAGDGGDEAGSGAPSG